MEFFSSIFNAISPQISSNSDYMNINWLENHPRLSFSLIFERWGRGGSQYYQFPFPLSLSYLSSSNLVKTIYKLMFREYDAIAPAKTIFASNTSSLPIAEIASATNRLDRYIDYQPFKQTTYRLKYYLDFKPYGR